MERENLQYRKKTIKTQLLQTKVSVIITCMLLISTSFSLLGMTTVTKGVVPSTQDANKGTDPTSKTAVDSFTISEESNMIDPKSSTVELTDANTKGLTTCPIGDGPEYHFLKITIRNALSQGIPGIPVDAFAFKLTAAAGTQYFGTLSCTFIGCVPVISTAEKICTNKKGEILFRIIGDTTIIGDIIIHVIVAHTSVQILEDTPLLSCKSFDFNVDGIVDCTDYRLFLYTDSLQGDFDWDGDVDDMDHKMFLLHLKGPCQFNDPPITPSDPDPENQSLNVSINTKFSWSSGDPNSDDMVTYTMSVSDRNSNIFSFIIGTYPATEHRITWTPTSLHLEYGTHYLWRITSTDDKGLSVTGPFWSFRTENYSDTESPSQVPGFQVSAEKDRQLDLVWSPATDNIAVDYYVLSRIDDHGFTITTHNLSYTDLGLTNGQTYTYEIYAVDTSSNKGPVSTTNGTPKAAISSHHRQGSSSNKAPIADLSAGAPYQGVVGEELLFDGSRSFDRDGSIIKYKWTFDGQSEGFGEIVIHTFETEGSYQVTLKVTDNRGATDDASTIVIIRKPNLPPMLLSFSGQTRGLQHFDYIFRFSASDPDGETMRYIITWGDGTSSVSPVFKDERIIQTLHKWDSPGFYTITLQAEDMQKARSESMSLVVWIGVWYVKDIGYLINIDGTGVFDQFYSNSTGTTSITKMQESNTYLLDVDGDGTWEFQYNSESDVLTPRQLQQQNYLLIILFVMLGGLFIIFLYIILTKKKMINYQNKKSGNKAKNPR
jgi:chitodextrinase